MRRILGALIMLALFGSIFVSYGLTIGWAVAVKIFATAFGFCALAFLAIVLLVDKKP